MKVYVGATSESLQMRTGIDRSIAPENPTDQSGSAQQVLYIPQSDLVLRIVTVKLSADTLMKLGDSA